MTMRARARTSSPSVFVGLVVTCGATMRKVTGSNPVVFSGIFYPYGTLSRRGDQFDSGECTKKNSTFSDFRLCPCLAGDPIMKFFSQLNPAHRGRAKFPGIVDLARITASSATAPAELKFKSHAYRVMPSVIRASPRDRWPDRVMSLQVLPVQ